MKRRVFRNYYKGHMDKTKGGGWNQGREVCLAGGGRGGEQMYNNKVIKKTKKIQLLYH